MKLVGTKSILVLSFGAMFALMVLLAMTATGQMNLTFQSIEHIVKNNNIKTNLISIMLISARERTISLQKMTRLEDAFDRDEEWLRFNASGARFAQARKTLVDLGLSEAEQAILDKQGEKTNQIAPIQLQIAELTMQDQLVEAEELLSSDAIPGQDQVFVELYKLLSLLENETNQTFINVSNQLVQAKAGLTTTIAGIVISGILMGYFVTWRISTTEKQLSREKERAQVTLHSIGDGVITTDAQGRIKYMNTVAEQLIGLSLKEVQSAVISHVISISSESDQKKMSNPVLNVIENGKRYNSDGNARLVLKSGHEYAIEYTASPILDNKDTLVGAVLVFRDVTEMRAMARQLGYQASHDELTGLINRREFENRVEMALITARSNNLEHAMCYLDLDQFKVVNDTCGHIAGDELLRQLSGQLNAEIRAGDTLARLGGDEFGVLYLNCTLKKARELAERLRKVVNDFQFNWDNKSFTVGVSMGLVAIKAHNNLHGLLSAADAACYVAKDEGRNRIHCFDENDNQLAERKGQMQWVHKITRALEENRFRIYCQSIRSFATGTEDHFEILVRLINSKGEVVPPMAFIPAAERYNLMTWVDRWVVHNALVALKPLQTKAEASGRQLLFALNISAQSLCDDAFLPFVQDEMRQLSINPACLCFEVTETSAIVNLTRAQHFIKTLKELGCYFALDDFGSGLSSFGYLKNLQVDFLKIDGAFVRDILIDPIDKALVESINQVGHVMGIKTVAEYVENRQILEELRLIGVDLVQGYEISKPFPIENLSI